MVLLNLLIIVAVVILIARLGMRKLLVGAWCVWFMAIIVAAGLSFAEIPGSRVLALVVANYGVAIIALSCLVFVWSLIASIFSNSGSRLHDECDPTHSLHSSNHVIAMPNTIYYPGDFCHSFDSDSDDDV